MTQENKDLLLKDLCARLPYGVKGSVRRNDHNNRKCEFVATIDGKLYDRFAVFQESWYDNVTIKPYLFPLSSMNEEQKEELLNYIQCDIIVTHQEIDFIDYSDYRMENWEKLFNWLNKNHFDYKGLIPMGLAIDATGLNIY